MPEQRLPEGIQRLCPIICGCGQPEEAWRYVHLVLQYASTQEGRDKRENSPLKPTTCDGWFALYALDSTGLIDHGSNIQWSWLHPRGVAALAFLDIYGPDWQEASYIRWVDDDGCCWSVGQGAEGTGGPDADAE